MKILLTKTNKRTSVSKGTKKKLYLDKNIIIPTQPIFDDTFDLTFN